MITVPLLTIDNQKDGNRKNEKNNKISILYKNNFQSCQSLVTLLREHPLLP
jgi:hypothetical protein